MVVFRYVDSNAAGAQNGASPANAWISFHQALTQTTSGINNMTNPNDEVIVIIRRVHSSTEASTLPAISPYSSGRPTFKFPLRFMKHDPNEISVTGGTLVSGNDWNGDPEQKPIINGNGGTLNNQIDFDSTGTYVHFKGIRFINFRPSASASTNAMIRATSVVDSGPWFFEDCDLERTDPGSANVSQNALVAPKPFGCKFTNCNLLTPRTLVYLSSASTLRSAGYLEFDKCNIKFTDGSSSRQLIGTDSAIGDDLGSKVTFRYCKYQSGSATLDSYIAGSAGTWLGDLSGIKVIVDHCDFAPSNIIGAANLGNWKDIDPDGGLTVAGKGTQALNSANAEIHEFHLPGFSIFRDTTASKLRAGGSNSMQLVTLPTTYTNGWDGSGPQISAKNGPARILMEFKLRWDTTHITKLSWFVRPEGWGTPPTVQPLLGTAEGQLFFTVDFISNTSPFTVTTLDSRSDTTGTLTENAWNELKITNGSTGLNPAAANGFLRLVMYLQKFTASAVLYVEPDVTIS